jgi:hypothetical protein
MARLTAGIRDAVREGESESVRAAPWRCLPRGMNIEQFGGDRISEEELARHRQQFHN